MTQQEFRPRPRRQLSVYCWSCRCGAELESHSRQGKCPSCGHEFRIDRPGPNGIVPTIAQETAADRHWANIEAHIRRRLLPDPANPLVGLTDAIDGARRDLKRASGA